MPQIELHNARKSFGSLVVIDDLSMHLDEGEALGVIGPNGAGKTTLFNLISGGLAPDAGRIAFDGADITALPAHERCRRGIGRSYQIPHPFVGMTVFENLLVGAAFGADRLSAEQQRLGAVVVGPGLGRAAADTLATRGELRPLPAAEAFGERLNEHLESGAGRFAKLAIAEFRDKDAS